MMSCTTRVSAVARGISVLVCCFGRDVLVVFGIAVDHPASEDSCDKCSDGTDNGKGQAHEGVGGSDRVNASLWRRDEKTGAGTMAGALLAERDARGNDTAGTQRERNTQ